MTEATSSGGRSARAWLLGGCGGCLLLGLGAMALVVGVGVQTVRSLREANASPKSRAAATLEILGARELPAGYRPTVAAAAPLGLFRVVILTDGAPGDDPQEGLPADRVFLYAEAIRGPAGLYAADVENGDARIREILERGQIRVHHADRGEPVARGVLEAAGARIVWVAERGRLDVEQTGPLEGLSTLMILDCPEDRRMRLALWTVPDPDPATPVDRLRVEGTSADPEAIREFLGGFRLCGD